MIVTGLRESIPKPLQKLSPLLFYYTLYTRNGLLIWIYGHLRLML